MVNQNPHPSPSDSDPHIQAEEGHPSGSIGLAKDTTSRQRLRAIESANVVQAKEAPLEDIVSALVLTIDPPSMREFLVSTGVQLSQGPNSSCVREVQKQFLENTLQELQVLLSEKLPLEFENPEGGPCMNRGIYVAKVPLVSGDLTIGLHIPLAREEIELFLRKGRIDHSEWDAMKSSVPGGEEGVFPFIRHRQDVLNVQVFPLLNDVLNQYLLRSKV